MKTVQTITRKGSFDSGHRVMNEKFKCFNMHGHTYLFELTFGFSESKEIGYAIDFKEIKRVGCQWIDDVLDHGMILNPHDTTLIKTTIGLGSKYWLMSLNGSGNYCNPSVENIAKELFLAQEVIFETYPNLWIESVCLWETPNCQTVCTKNSISTEEKENFIKAKKEIIQKYAISKGMLEYDDRIDSSKAFTIEN